MPELAEVETVRSDLESVALNQKIDRVEIFGHRTVRRHDPKMLIDELPGLSLASFRRHGKYLLCDLDDGRVLVIHLRMSGQLLWKESRDKSRISAPSALVRDDGSKVEKHTHARLFLDGGNELRFVDPRTFGELWLTSHDVPEMSHVGPDALTDFETVDEFRNALIKRKSAIKAVLLNQAVVAGIGNIYSDEMLWRAKVRYSKSPDKLTRPTIERLHHAMKEVLAEAVKNRGSSLADAQYVDLFGKTGVAQGRHDVYAREHQPCNRCEHPIRRAAFGGRSTFFCPNCQK